MKICFLLITLVLATIADGQGICTQADLANKPGLLRASKLRGSTGGMAASDVARARATLSKINQTITAGYKPTGVVGEYSHRFSGGKNAGTFGYSLYLLRYNCDSSSSDRSKFYIGTDTPTVVRVDANVIHALDLSAGDTADNSFRGYMFMRNMPKKIDGFYYLGDNPAGNAKPDQKEYTWLITYDDQLPFTTLSRKQYLLLIKERLDRAIKENGNSSGFYNEYVSRVNAHLQNSDAELSAPAIVNRTDEERFTGFLNEGAPGAFYAIRHNPSYYRKGLNLSSPQFFTVVYSVYEGDKVYVDNIESIKKSFDRNALRSMLGK